MRKRLVLLLILIFTLVFAACSAGGSSSQTSSQQSSSQTSSLLSGVIDAYDIDTLMNAVRSSDTTGVNIKADMTIGLSSIEYFEKSGFVMVIDAGVTLTMGDNFAPAFGSDTVSGFINNGTLLITGTFEFAKTTFENNGTIQIANEGMLAPYYGTIQNNGQIIIDAGGELRLESETTCNNAATVINNGTLKISSDGGVFHNLATGTLTNNKTIACVGTYTNEGKFVGEGEPLQ